MEQPFVICISNDEYPASLEKYKLYFKLHDTEAQKHHFIRVIDESGEDYLYPETYFAAVELPDEAMRAIMMELACQEVGTVKKPTVPLKDIVKDKYVVCLECGKRMRTLKAHLRKAHNLTPMDYFKRFGLDPKKYLLVCKEYSGQRRKLARGKSLAALRSNITKSA
ncbi:MAG: MucR family transcriptional regulator [Desulfobaccales bacterium]|jgi:predicted transcriptional regulator